MKSKAHTIGSLLRKFMKSKRLPVIRGMDERSSSGKSRNRGIIHIHGKKDGKDAETIVKLKRL